MKTLNVSEFKKLIRVKRKEIMQSPFDLTYQSFKKLEYTAEDKNFFLENASEIVESMRKKTWDDFLEDEKHFSYSMYEQLIDIEAIREMDKTEAIKWFLEKHSDHIYALSLSNTQSRRSRAGNEFELILEFILMGAQIPFDTQGSVGSGIFKEAHLAKLVDCVSPGAVEYNLDKRNTSLISAKTTLRERWQEVGDEMARTMAREMYLATLDEEISDNTIELIGSNNIILVTTKGNKEELYVNSPNVISFEQMLQELDAKTLTWRSYVYPQEQLNIKKEGLSQLIIEAEDKPFLVDYYTYQLNMLESQNIP